jgi:hypothetical protein
MDVREAVKRAKTYVAEVFEDDKVTNLGLEEIEYDENSGAWNVTLGFSRSWDTTPQNPLSVITGADNRLRRTYRVVRVRDTDGEVLSVKLREPNVG